MPELPQVACFDTAFHATMPEEGRRLPLPAEFASRGLRRYGFHGLSYESIVARLPALVGELPSRLVIAHLGNGASMCAVKDGRSVATTMGFSTLDGLLMATRSGSIDPGVLLHLMREGYGLAELEDLLYNRAGLLGLSGISADMKFLLESKAPAASAAVAFYCYRISRELGSLAAALVGWMRSSSPAAWARTPPRSAPRSAGRPTGLASPWMGLPISPTGRASPREIAPLAPGW